MKRLATVLGTLLLVLCAGMAAAGDEKYLKQYTPKAMKGDYQSQRNLAWTYATSNDPFVSNPMLGCAWYKLIILSGSQKVGPGDIGNVKVYCGKCSQEEQAVADQQAQRLYREIYEKR